MNRFISWIWKLFRDETGEVGTDLADNASDKDTKGDQGDAELDDDFKDEDFDELTIDLDEKEEDEDKEAKKKADEAKSKETNEENKRLHAEVETWKEKEKTWKRDSYQTRKDREAKALETDKDAKPLTDAQLQKLLDDADIAGDSTVKLNVLKYLAQQSAKGEASKLVNAAEMTRKADDYNRQLETKFPDIKVPTSDMRADLDLTKEELGIADHPFGDMFAVGFKLFQDMDALLEAAVEAGKEEALKGTADKKRKEEIKEKSLPSSKRSPYKKTHGLTTSQLETAKLMNLSPDQLPAYAKLVGKKPRTVSVEG